MPQSQGKKKTIVRALIGASVLFVAIQIVPYGRNHTNPPVTAEPEWDSPATRETFFRVCKNCHSNETEWPFYSHIAPASWLVQRDVTTARKHFNVSEWGRRRNKGYEAAEEVRRSEMPPFYYLPLHPEARLTPEERQEFVRGLVRTFGDRSGERSRAHSAEGMAQ